MSESLRSVRPNWIAFGWFISVSISSLALLAISAFGLIDERPATEALWVAVSILVGFFIGGFFTGTRVAAAPILHGFGIGVASVLAFLILNLTVGEALGEATWRTLEAGSFAGLLILQGVAAVVGTRMGVRWMRARPGLT